jgi:hypothetical protein
MLEIWNAWYFYTATVLKRKAYQSHVYMHTASPVLIQPADYSNFWFSLAMGKRPGNISNKLATTWTYGGPIRALSLSLYAGR